MPGAASEIQEPLFENDARAPSGPEAATARPVPAAPFEPTGWSRAAGYSTGLPSPCSLPAAAITRTPCAIAERIAFRSVGDVVVPPTLRLMIFAPCATGRSAPMERAATATP